MNSIQTLYLNESKNVLLESFGWAAPEYHLMGWALSCLQLHNTYGRVDLYCNKGAYSILSEELKLPYNNYYLTHDELQLQHEKLWALPKIYTYSLQTEPFMHFDGDVFLFDQLPTTLLNADLICQNVEEATEYYSKVQKQLEDSFSYLPDCVKNDFDAPTPFRAVNAGMLGGNNLTFINEYCKEAFSYIDNNLAYLPNVNVDLLNVFFEQHLFYSMAKERGCPVSVLINDVIKDNQYLHLNNFHEVPCKRNYLHLLGQYKRDEHTCRQMAAKLRQLYPEYYYRIIQLFRDKRLPVISSVYGREALNSFSSYQIFSALATETFNKEPAIVEATTVIRKILQSLTILKAVIEDITDYSSFQQEDIEKDFAIFSAALVQVKEKQAGYETAYLYGRDIDSVNWYCSIFGADEIDKNKQIEKCPVISIIHSGFDWAGILNKQLRVGVRHYEELEILPGDFYNLVVPEVFGDGFSLQDIDEMEKLILDHLTGPMTPGALFIEMQAYVEDDIIANHLTEYEELLTVMLQQLVLKKAVKPAKNQSN